MTEKQTKNALRVQSFNSQIFCKATLAPLPQLLAQLLPPVIPNARLLTHSAPAGMAETRQQFGCFALALDRPFHDPAFRFLRPKKSHPFHCVPVMARATAESDLNGRP
jgi:hypothetical protein